MTQERRSETRIGIRLGPNLRRLIEAEANRRGVTISQIVREALARTIPRSRSRALTAARKELGDSNNGIQGPGTASP